MKKGLLVESTRLARQKLDTHPEYYNYPHFSFIVMGNKLIGHGTNIAYPPRKNYGYESRIHGGEAKLHAEIIAWRRCRSLLQGRDFEMINIRLNRTGDLRNSAPCKCCFSILSSLGCSRFWFSTEVGTFLKT